MFDTVITFCYKLAETVYSMQIALSKGNQGSQGDSVIIGKIAFQ